MEPEIGYLPGRFWASCRLSHRLAPVRPARLENAGWAAVVCLFARSFGASPFVNSVWMVA